jgi:hypothetical protein
VKGYEQAADLPVAASAEVPSVKANEAETAAEAERTPNEAELAEALRLLTPATNADANSAGQRWVAENVAVSPEEAKISLEAEMMGIASSKPATAVADTAASAAETTGDRSIGFSGIAAAVENRLAEAGLGTGHKTWASQQETLAEDAAAEVAAALEASAELLAAASAATPVVEQIDAHVERQLSMERNENERKETERSEIARQGAEPNEIRSAEIEHKEPQGSFAEHTPTHEGDSATFADAMSGDRSEIGLTTGRDEAPGNLAARSAAAIEGANHNSNTEVGGDNSMGNNGKTKSGKSNWQEMKGAAAGVPQADPIEAAKQDTSAPEIGQKAMAAGAGENSGSATDSSTIASIGDSVMADLRPRIVEEIARKLAKK